MEDDLKILKVEYLSNCLLDHTQILNLSLHDQTIFCKSFKWRQPPMEDDLKKIKVEYLNNHLLDPNFKLKIRLPKIKGTNSWNEDDLQSKMTSKYHKGKISATTVWIMTYEFLGGI